MAYDANGVPVRRGKSVQLTIEQDAAEILDDMAVGPKTKGRVVTELLRAELCRREERARLRRLLLDALAEPVHQDPA